MNFSGDFSGRVLRLDSGVWLVMLTTCVLSLALLGFKRLGTRNCYPLAITVNGRTEAGVAVHNPGLLLNFGLAGVTAGTVVWNFGDGTGRHRGTRITHRYTRAGNFTVVATVPGGCRYEQYITIQDAFTLDANLPERPVIYTVPQRPRAGETIRFFGYANAAVHSYTWKVLGSADSLQHGDEAAFNFPYPGTYKVQLMLDEDPARTVSVNITVSANAEELPGIPPASGTMPGGGLPGSGASNPFEGMGGAPGGAAAPPATNAAATPATPAEAAPLLVDPETFKGMLQEVVAGNKEVEDLYRYLDYKGTTKVRLNDGQPVNLPLFCKNMAAGPEKQIEKLVFVKDDQNRILSINVTVPERRPGFFQRIFGRRG